MIMEDQISPKRCPICVDETNTLIPIEEAVGKIRAAVENKLKKDTVIIARTDATNREELMKRAKAYHDAGADLIQPISRAFSNKEEVKDFVKSVGCPVSLVIVGWLESLTAEDIHDIGPKIAHFALISVTAAHAAIKQALQFVGKNHTAVNLPQSRTGHGELVDFLGIKRVSDLETKYLPDESTIYHS